MGSRPFLLSLPSFLSFTSSSLGKWFWYRCGSESKGCLLRFLGSGVLDQRPGSETQG